MFLFLDSKAIVENAVCYSGATIFVILFLLSYKGVLFPLGVVFYLTMTQKYPFPF
jgi:hypothetical protein